MELEPKSCEERGKRQKLEPELNLGPEVKQEIPPTYEWLSKPAKDLKASDFSMFDDDPEPFMFERGHFVYKNDAFIKQQQEIKVAMAEYRRLSRNLSVRIILFSINFAICMRVSLIIIISSAQHNTTQHSPLMLSPFQKKKKDLSAQISRLDMTDERRIKLTPFCELALNKYNHENQVGSKQF
jgi:hypothetical protein